MYVLCDRGHSVSNGAITYFNPHVKMRESEANKLFFLQLLGTHVRQTNSY
jgi:hypothetical protein